jgi:hypothetical protein
LSFLVLFLALFGAVGQWICARAAPEFIAVNFAWFAGQPLANRMKEKNAINSEAARAGID